MRSPLLFRGEWAGEGLRQKGGVFQPWFFAESFGHAKTYAGLGSQPIAAHVHARRVLDLTAPDPLNPEHRRVVEGFSAQYEEWLCRYSGEPRDLWSFLEAGDLYDYDGCAGRNSRWESLFLYVLDDCGYDAVRVIDCTDGPRDRGVPSTIWVTASLDCVRLASVAQELQGRLAQQDGQAVLDWVEGHHHDLWDRLERLASDHLVALDATHANALRDWLCVDHARAVKPGDRIRPASGSGVEHALAKVAADDVRWDRVDQAYIYCPRHLNAPGRGPLELLSSLSLEQLEILCAGEMASIRRHRAAIKRIEAFAMGQPSAQSDIHGPDHWARVQAQGVAVARSLGIDPLVPYVFGLVHDSHRENDGRDIGHGPRAAKFVRDKRSELFGFLSDEQVEQLRQACKLHSLGDVEAPAAVQACWDADRLDLGRPGVGITPDPDYLCTQYAKALACAMVGGEAAADQIGEALAWR